MIKKFIAIVLCVGVSGFAEATTTFMEAGSDATQGLEFYQSTTGAVTSESTIVYTGTRSIKLDTGNPAANAQVITPNGSVSDSGTRATWRFRFATLPGTIGNTFAFQTAGGGSNVFTVRVNTSGTLNLNAIGASTVNGTTAMSVNTWYRISVAYVITSSTNFEMRLYLNGVLEASISSSGTLTNTGTSVIRMGGNTNWGVDRIQYIDDVYIDDGTTLDDIGDIRVTNRRPISNGTTNGYTTQIGSGGSSYGTGHAPQVNEQPLSTTNGWSMVGAGAAVTEEYNIEREHVGDVDLSSVRFVDFAGWLYSASTGSQTAQIILNNATSNISLTTTNTMFTKFAGSPTYPPGTGTDIGQITSTDLQTVSLYEAGVLVAYLPAYPRRNVIITEDE